MDGDLGTDCGTKLTREQARFVGANRYFGKVCTRHPAAEGKRRTRSAECVECRKERQIRWRRKHAKRKMPGY
jgi:hypothetical protein